jgi:hypothetical protein
MSYSTGNKPVIQGPWRAAQWLSEVPCLNSSLVEDLVAVHGVHKSRLPEIARKLARGERVDFSQFTEEAPSPDNEAPSPDNVVQGHFSPPSGKMSFEELDRTLEIPYPHEADHSGATTIRSQAAPSDNWNALVKVLGAEGILAHKFDPLEPVAIDGDLFIQADGQAEFLFQFLVEAIGQGRQVDVVVSDALERTRLERDLVRRYEALQLSRPITFPILTEAQVERKGYCYNLLISERSGAPDNNTGEYDVPLCGVMRFNTIAPSVLITAQSRPTSNLTEPRSSSVVVCAPSL